MRTPERSWSYFVLLLLALAAGAVRVDAEVPDGAPGDVAGDRAWSGCGETARGGGPFCERDRALALSES